MDGWFKSCHANVCIHPDISYVTHASQPHQTYPFTALHTQTPPMPSGIHTVPSLYLEPHPAQPQTTYRPDRLKCSIRACAYQNERRTQVVANPCRWTRQAAASTPRSLGPELSQRAQLRWSAQRAQSRHERRAAQPHTAKSAASGTAAWLATSTPRATDPTGRRRHVPRGRTQGIMHGVRRAPGTQGTCVCGHADRAGAARGGEGRGGGAP